MKEKVLVLLGLVLCLLLIIGFTKGFNESSEETTTNGEQQIDTNLQQEISGLGIRVNGVTYEEEKADELVVKIDLTIENKRDSSVNFTPMNMSLMDSEHYSYSHASHIDTKGILSGQLGAGRSVSGELAFIVPTGTEFELIYTDHFREGQLFFPIELD